MTANDLRNAIAILKQLYYNDVEHIMSHGMFEVFKADPALYFISCDDPTAEKLFAVIKAQMDMVEFRKARAVGSGPGGTLTLAKR